MASFAFTLYEVFGYVFPGGIAFTAFVIIYWALFVPTLPLGIATFHPGLVTWTSIVFISYVLGHATQALGNISFRPEEQPLDSVVGTRLSWMTERAQRLAAELLSVDTDKLDAECVCKTL